MSSRRGAIQLLEQVLSHLREEADAEEANGTARPTIAAQSDLQAAAAQLRDASVLDLASNGDGPTLRHVLADIVPALNGQAGSGRYYGFVTGGVLPIAQAADVLVSAYDQNVQVHLPGETISTEVEDVALRMLIRLLGLDGAVAGLSAAQVREACEMVGRGAVTAEEAVERVLGTARMKGTGTGTGTGTGDGGEAAGVWAGRTFTTGATASNILGLACGREWSGRTQTSATAARPVILATRPHSSIAKAASIVGIGRASLVDVSCGDQPWRLDLAAVDHAAGRLRASGHAVIVVVGAGEVNTGFFATEGLREMLELRRLADRHGAWVHVDGAFGIFARALPVGDEFAVLRDMAGGLELADSICMDGHKMLNVPYDCGVFLTKHLDILTQVCKNEAPYLEAKQSTPMAAAATTSATGIETSQQSAPTRVTQLASSSSPLATNTVSAPKIQSPLNVGIENSRRFRALPIYAVLRSQGRAGFADIFARQVRLARGVVRYLRGSGLASYELLPLPPPSSRKLLAGENQQLARTHVVVLFRPRGRGDAARRVAALINATRRIYVTATDWVDGETRAEAQAEGSGTGTGAIRLAVSSWMVDVERDLDVVEEVLEEAAAAFQNSHV